MSKSWREAVESAFPEAMVTVQESLVAACANHEKDRHVLAASIRGHAELIVTSNLKHFVTGGNQGRDIHGDERDRRLKGIRLRVTDRGLCPSLRVVVYCEYFVAFGGAGRVVLGHEDDGKSV